MKVIISNTANKPIYEQIYIQIKEQIISGSLQDDDALPSIRAMARELRISVITTRHAYDDLERDGYIYSMPGKGFFVAPRNMELIREEYLRQIEEHLTKAVDLAAAIGLSREEFTEILDLCMEQGSERNDPKAGALESDDAKETDSEKETAGALKTNGREEQPT